MSDNNYELAMLLADAACVRLDAAEFAGTSYLEVTAAGGARGLGHAALIALALIGLVKVVKKLHTKLGHLQWIKQYKMAKLQKKLQETKNPFVKKSIQKRIDTLNKTVAEQQAEISDKLQKASKKKQELEQKKEKAAHKKSSPKRSTSQKKSSHRKAKH